MENKSHVPNHQPVNIIEYYIVGKIFPSQWIGLRKTLFLMGKTMVSLK